MTSIPSLLLESEFSRGKVQIVVNDDQILRGGSEEVNDTLDRLSTEIHEGVGFNKKDLL